MHKAQGIAQGGRAASRKTAEKGFAGSLATAGPKLYLRVCELPIHIPLTPHSLPRPVGQLRAEGWDRLTTCFPDKAVISAIRGICRVGARIGYEGVRESPTIHPNLSTAEVEIPLVTSDITTEMSKNHLLVYREKEALPTHYTASPLGLTDKADGSKKCIHHLSYPTLDTNSINGGIPEHYGTIIYSGISDAIQAIQERGKYCLLAKRDFEWAFHHIPVAPLDSPLLEFHWNGTYYAEAFLPFGLRTAPYLFNLFAEVFHWILEEELKTLGLRVRIIHYLDDFPMVLHQQKYCPAPCCILFAPSAGRSRRS